MTFPSLRHFNFCRWLWKVFESRQRYKIFPFSKTFRMPSLFSKPPIHWPPEFSGRGWKHRGVNLPFSYLLPRLRKSGAIPLLSTYAFMVWAETNLHRSTVWKKPANFRED